MSEFDDRVNKMRSLVIFAPEGKSVFDLLRESEIEGWEWSRTHFPQGAAEFCLRKGEEFVALYFESFTSSRATSLNVIPYDWNHDPVGANALIQELSVALTSAGIDNSVIASQNDRFS
ncbi:TPA: hypothetical protein ACGVA1_004193 [Vibrio vulnificus]